MGSCALSRIGRLVNCGESAAAYFPNAAAAVIVSIIAPCRHHEAGAGNRENRSFLRHFCQARPSAKSTRRIGAGLPGPNCASVLFDSNFRIGARGCFDPRRQL